MTEADLRPERGIERRIAAVTGAQRVTDEVIDSLAAGLAEDDEERGGAEGDAAPFDLGIPEPRALHLRRLWKIAGKKPDPQVLAALGPNIPILLSHSVTAFPVGPSKPPRVWGIRYQSELFGVDARTVSLQPTTELIDLVTVGAEAELEIGLGGELALPTVAKAAIDTLPGVTLNDAKIGAGVHESARLRIRFTLSVPKVISGAEARGGARWHLYAQDRRLDGHQALVQTLLVPKGTKRVRIDIISSVAAAGWFGARQWRYETESF